MPFCPNCKIEYRDGFTTCSECGQELVDNLQPVVKKENRQIDSQPAFLISGSTGSDSMIIEGCLRSADIPYLKKDRESGGYLRVVSGFSVFGSDYYVPSALLTRAKEALGATALYNSTTDLKEKEADANPSQANEQEESDIGRIPNETSLFRRIGAILTLLFWWL
jgi:hypothetical protein